MYSHRLKIRLQDILFYLFLFGMIVFENGTTISKIYKVIFVSLSFFYVLTKGLHWPRSYHFLWLISVFLFDVLSYTWAFSKETAFAGIRTVGLNTLCIALFIMLLIKNKNWLEPVINGLILFPIFRFAGAFVENGTDVFSGLRNINGFRDYNTIAMFAAIGVVFAFFQYRYIRKSMISVAMGIINLLIVAISLSRKGILYLVLPILLMYIIESKKISKTIRNIIITMIGLIIAYEMVMNIPFLYNMIGKGLEGVTRYLFTGTGDSSSAARNDRITFGLRMMASKPWFGYGVQNYNYFFARSGHVTENMIVADNNYIDVLFNTGIVGLILYYSAHITYVIKYIRNKNKTLINKLGFSLLLTLVICDYGVSSYLYMHSQFLLALSALFISMKDIDLEKNKNA